MEGNSRNSKAEALYERHHREVHQYIVGAFGFDRSIADDLTLDVFVRLWQSARLDAGPIPRGYVFVVARNACLEYRRNSGRQKRDTGLTVSIEDLASLDGISSNGSPLEDAFALGELLRRLPETEREVITLVDGPSGLTIEEAAGIMSISRRSARHLRDKGFRRLEKWRREFACFGGQNKHGH